jgi:hypothetical protein
MAEAEASNSETLADADSSTAVTGLAAAGLIVGKRRLLDREEMRGKPGAAKANLSRSALESVTQRWFSKPVAEQLLAERREGEAKVARDKASTIHW